MFVVLGGVVLGGIVFLLFGSFANQNNSPSGNSQNPDGVISNNGLHWHARLAIKIKGENRDIPANMGLGAVHNPIHTHDSTGEIHYEFGGTVREQDIKLKKFFDAWGKQFSSTCVLDRCNGPEGQVKMLVNGVPNNEFENYIPKNGDNIEIVFE